MSLSIKFRNPYTPGEKKKRKTRKLGILPGLQEQNESSVTSNKPEARQRYKNKKKWRDIIAEYENGINDYIQQSDSRFKCALLGVDKLRLLNKDIQQILKTHYFNFPNNKLQFLTGMLAFYTTEDYTNSKYSNPYSLLLFGATTVMQLNGTQKRAIQILFGITPREYRGFKLQIKLQDKSESLNYHLRLILLSLAKLYKIPYVVTEAVAWTSQRQSEKLGFQVLTNKQYIPSNNTYHVPDGFSSVNHIIRHAFQQNPTIALSDITPHNIEQYTNGIGTDRNKKMRAFLMKHKNKQNMKYFINQFKSTVGEDSLFAWTNGAKYGTGHTRVLRGNHKSRQGYLGNRDEKESFRFTHFFVVNDSDYSTNPYWQILNSNYKNRNTLRLTEQNLQELLAMLPERANISNSSNSNNTKPTKKRKLNQESKK